MTGGETTGTQKKRGKNKRKRTIAGLIRKANSANPRYLCLLSAVRLLKSTSTQDGYVRACSAKTPELARPLASRDLLQELEASTARSA